MNDCLFCQIVQKRIPAKIVHEDEHTLAFDDINPQAPVHTLIIPKQHVQVVGDLRETDSDSWLNCCLLVPRSRNTRVSRSQATAS